MIKQVQKSHKCTLKEGWKGVDHLQHSSNYSNMSVRENTTKILFAIHDVLIFEALIGCLSMMNQSFFVSRTLLSWVRCPLFFSPLCLLSLFSLALLFSPSLQSRYSVGDRGVRLYGALPVRPNPEEKRLPSSGVRPDAPYLHLPLQLWSKP